MYLFRFKTIFYKIYAAVLILIILSGIGMNLYFDVNKKDIVNAGFSIFSVSESNTPGKSVRINRIFDEKGKLIKFDSTSYFCSDSCKYKHNIQCLNNSNRSLFFENEVLSSIKIIKKDSSFPEDKILKEIVTKKFVHELEHMRTLISHMDSINLALTSKP